MQKLTVCLLASFPAPPLSLCHFVTIFFFLLITKGKKSSQKKSAHKKQEGLKTLQSSNSQKFIDDNI